MNDLGAEVGRSRIWDTGFDRRDERRDRARIGRFEAMGERSSGESAGSPELEPQTFRRRRCRKAHGQVAGGPTLVPKGDVSCVADTSRCDNVLHRAERGNEESQQVRNEIPQSAVPVATSVVNVSAFQNGAPR